MPRPLVRLWRAPLLLHAAALAVLVGVVMVGVVGTGASLSADEGAAIIQAKQLARGDGWVTPSPVPAADPDDEFFPLQFSEAGTKGVVPFGKHPFYALVLAGADDVGGVDAMVLLSVLGTAVAALLAGVVASDLVRAGAGPVERAPDLARAALWLTGLASPLFVDSSLVIAHTLGAAAVALVGWAAVRVVVDGRGGLRVAGLCAVAAAAVVLGVLLRTEVTLAGLAVGGVVGLLGLVRRRPAAVVFGLVAGAAAVGARLLERAWVRSITGPSVTLQPSAPGTESFGFLDGRWHAFRITWLSPQYGGLQTTGLLVGVAALATVLGAVALWRAGGRAAAGQVLSEPGSGARSKLDADLVALTAWAVIAGGAACLAVVLGGPDLVPGLLVAFPLLAAGLVVAGLQWRWLLTTEALLVLAAAFVAFSLAVLLTQYGQGGSIEWGGRYFAVGLPLAVPVVALALHRAGRGLPEPFVQRGLAGAVAVSLALSVAGVQALRTGHDGFDTVVTSLRAAVRQVPPGDGGVPVAVTTDPTVPRSFWADFPDTRWLLAAPADLPHLESALVDAGIDRFTLVSGVASPPRSPKVRVVSSRIDPASGYLLVVLAAR